MLRREEGIVEIEKNLENAVERHERMTQIRIYCRKIMKICERTIQIELHVVREHSCTHT